MATYRAHLGGKEIKNIYPGGKKISRVYGGNILLWKNIKNRPMNSQYFMVNAMLSEQGDHLIDEYGVWLDVNKDAIIEKCAVYLVHSGWKWERTIACKGQNITYARYVPYLAYQGEIIYDGLTTSDISTYNLSRYSGGVWNYDNYSMITANLKGADGQYITEYSIGVGGANTRIFYDLEKMKEWLKS